VFVVLSYDVGKKRVKKALRVCRKYLTHIHRSVFEGPITEAQLAQLERELREVVKKKDDSVVIYRITREQFASKDELGRTELHGHVI
jgi:CRISPR-associated endoribonuclease cas2